MLKNISIKMRLFVALMLVMSGFVFYSTISAKLLVPKGY